MIVRVAAAVLAAAVGLGIAQDTRAASIEIRSARIPLYPSRPNDLRAGALTFRGGLELNSGDRHFGGWSDMAVSADGSRLLALSDRSNWLRARLLYDPNGNLAGMAEGEIDPLLDMNGRPLEGRQGDSEGLALERDGDIDGPVIVSFELDVRIWRYDFSKGRDAQPASVPIGNWVNRLRPNAQLEAVAILKPDTLIAFGEMKPAPGEDLLAALEAYPGNAGPHTRALSVVPHDPFAITSAARAPDGGVFLLERRFSLVGGIGTELRHIPAADIVPGARLDGEVLMNLGFQDANIDNMEGVAVRRGPRGETLIYVISDNNFSPIQRTLLLMFEWPAKR